jgi:hypothetical protein
MICLASFSFHSILFFSHLSPGFHAAKLASNDVRLALEGIGYFFSIFNDAIPLPFGTNEFRHFFGDDLTRPFPGDVIIPSGLSHIETHEVPSCHPQTAKLLIAP